MIIGIKLQHLSYSPTLAAGRRFRDGVLIHFPWLLIRWVDLEAMELNGSHDERIAVWDWSALCKYRALNPAHLCPAVRTDPRSLRRHRLLYSNCWQTTTLVRLIKHQKIWYGFMCHKTMTVTSLVKSRLSNYPPTRKEIQEKNVLSLWWAFSKEKYIKINQFLIQFKNHVFHKIPKLHIYHKNWLLFLCSV